MGIAKFRQRFVHKLKVERFVRISVNQPRDFGLRPILLSTYTWKCSGFMDISAGVCCQRQMFGNVLIHFFPLPSQLCRLDSHVIREVCYRIALPFLCRRQRLPLAVHSCYSWCAHRISIAESCHENLFSKAVTRRQKLDVAEDSQGGS